jgi:hypothetical protein
MSDSTDTTTTTTTTTRAHTQNDGPDACDKFCIWCDNTCCYCCCDQMCICCICCPNSKLAKASRVCCENFWHLFGC